MVVCLSVRLFVRHTFSSRLTVFLSPLPEVHCPNFLDIRNPWGKVMERSVSRFEHCAHKWSKITAAKIFLGGIFFFICSFRLNIFLPTFPEVQCLNCLDFWNPGGKVMERRGLRSEIFYSYRVQNCRAKKSFSWRILPFLPIFLVLVLLSALVERFFVSPLQDFFYIYFLPGCEASQFRFCFQWCLPPLVTS